MSFVEAPFADIAVPENIRDSRRLVLKFGGSSVATLENWQNIAKIIQARIVSGYTVVVVHSALAGVSNSLRDLLDATTSGQGDEQLAAVLAAHTQLAAEMGLNAEDVIAELTEELSQLIAGAKLVREVSPRVHARVMGLGELMATRLSAAWLESQGMRTSWRDAREFMCAQGQVNQTDRQRYLSALCDFSVDTELQQTVDSADAVIITQGFIASNDDGETVLLGRGGSDTSAAYLAARLEAQRLEIWSDVPGVFSSDPRLVTGARLLSVLHYDEAQEIASTGGSVIHPRAIAPVRDASIPIFLRCTSRPEIAGTTVAAVTPDDKPVVKAVSIQSGVTLISMEGIAMWQTAGYLADLFRVFAQFSVSVDLVSTSESNVTVSIDPAAGELSKGTLEQLVAALSEQCRVELLENCAAISLVGRRIRAILHKIGPAFGVFEEERVYLVSQAANDLNLSFVVDEDNGYRLVQQLHHLLFQQVRTDATFGMTWEEFRGGGPSRPPVRDNWWRRESDDLLAAINDEPCAYIYQLDEITAAAKRLTSMRSVGQVFFAMKANNNPEVLQTLNQAGVNFECVSPGELERVLTLFPDIDRQRILFTPNFAAREEYIDAFEEGVRVTLDNLYPLQQWPQVFEGRDVFVRLDPGQGRGHHEHVKTAGIHAKFGIPMFELDELERAANAARCSIVGIHAHSGSGILEPDNWEEVARALATAAKRFPKVRVLDLGGGLGVPERDEDKALDIQRLDDNLHNLREELGDYELWLEPGRYLVAEAGVLLARVTQVKGKGDKSFVGIATGMNSLIRPALYGAYHEIVNLSRIDAPATNKVTIVGPICESADKLGTDRLLASAEENDVILIANAGAYGSVMASNYNLRASAAEKCIKRS